VALGLDLEADASDIEKRVAEGVDLFLKAHCRAIDQVGKVLLLQNSSPRTGTDGSFWEGQPNS
ncbi:MAG: hypothetical protein K2X57_03410, partial [Xanthobacteraceae bacterium]|nr:hypothetical protein [Xanthobacteraceae bacterium]MBY0611244.1 hypothetical protein [Beijerinckiaceae bacterium]